MPSTSTILVPTYHHVQGMRVGGRAVPMRAFVEEMATAVAPNVVFASPHAVRFLAREALVASLSHTPPVSDDPAAASTASFALHRTLGNLRAAGTTVAHLREEGSREARVLAEILEQVDTPSGASGWLTRAPPRGW